MNTWWNLPTTSSTAGNLIGRRYCGGVGSHHGSNVAFPVALAGALFNADWYLREWTQRLIAEDEGQEKGRRK